MKINLNPNRARRGTIGLAISFLVACVVVAGVGVVVVRKVVKVADQAENRRRELESNLVEDLSREVERLYPGRRFALTYGWSSTGEVEFSTNVLGPWSVLPGLSPEGVPAYLDELLRLDPSNRPPTFFLRPAK